MIIDKVFLGYHLARNEVMRDTKSIIATVLATQQQQSSGVAVGASNLNSTPTTPVAAGSCNGCNAKMLNELFFLLSLIMSRLVL